MKETVNAVSKGHGGGIARSALGLRAALLDLITNVMYKTVVCDL